MYRHDNYFRIIAIGTPTDYSTFVSGRTDILPTNISFDKSLLQFSAAKIPLKIIEFQSKNLSSNWDIHIQKKIYG